jgi:hypothetical protein
MAGQENENKSTKNWLDFQAKEETAVRCKCLSIALYCTRDDNPACPLSSLSVTTMATLQTPGIT